MVYPKLLIIPLIVGIITFAIKILIRGLKANFNLDITFDYGGMPSVHTAFVTSLCTVIYIAEGAFSAAFAIAVIFSLIIIRDALGMRQIISFQSVALLRIIAKYPKKERELFPKRLEKHIGHTLAEVIVGFILGIVLALTFYLIIP